MMVGSCVVWVMPRSLGSPAGGGSRRAGLSRRGRVNTAGMGGALTIGEFARVTHLSVRTLRRYHDGGLLEPARVDPATGYRYYTSEQIPAAQVIHRLRELDMPLVEVR